jgi:hypothetical protein
VFLSLSLLIFDKTNSIPTMSQIKKTIFFELKMWYNSK